MNNRHRHLHNEHASRPLVIEIEAKFISRQPSGNGDGLLDLWRLRVSSQRAFHQQVKMSGPVSPTGLLATVLPLLSSVVYSLVDIAVQPFSPAKSSQGGIYARYRLIFKQASLVHSYSITPLVFLAPRCFTSQE